MLGVTVGRLLHRTNAELWAASGWLSVHCPWRKPAVWSQVLSLRDLVSRSKAVDECAFWVTFSSFAMQVIHMGMSAASQHCFETASWLRAYAVPVILYYHPLAQQQHPPPKAQNFMTKSTSQEHKSTKCCCLSSYCLLIKKLLRK